MPNIKLLLQYDGTDYSGWQIQPDRVTIQGLIEEKLRKITGEEINLLSAGRTDAGVHALGQVASFKTTSPHSPEVFKNALNGMLPSEIRVLSSSQADEQFHPRFDALGKIYFYLLDFSESTSPFLSRYSHHINYEIETAAMIKASLHLIGRHDFSSFRASGCGAMTTEREVQSIKLQEMEEIDFLTARLKGRFLRITIHADAFLRHMVRNIVGTLIEIGRGKIPPDNIRDIIKRKERKAAGPSVPARGLFLEKVFFAK